MPALLHALAKANPTEWEGANGSLMHSTRAALATDSCVRVELHIYIYIYIYIYLLQLPPQVLKQLEHLQLRSTSIAWTAAVS